MATKTKPTTVQGATKKTTSTKKPAKLKTRYVPTPKLAIGESKRDGLGARMHTGRHCVNAALAAAGDKGAPLSEIFAAHEKNAKALKIKARSEISTHLQSLKAAGLATNDAPNGWALSKLGRAHWSGAAKTERPKIV